MAAALKFCRRGLHPLAPGNLVIHSRRGKPERQCRACHQAARPKAKGLRNGIRCARGHLYDGTPTIRLDRRVPRIKNECRVCANDARTRRRRLARAERRLITMDKARGLTLRVLGERALLGRRFNGIIVGDDVVDDITSEAYLHYFAGWIRTGERSPSAYCRDVMDAYQKFFKSRRKVAVAVFTNADDSLALRPWVAGTQRIGHRW